MPAMLFDAGFIVRKITDALSHVFHGHAIVEQIITLGNRTFMDLGSYKTGDIGLIEPVAFLARLTPEERGEMAGQEQELVEETADV